MNHHISLSVDSQQENEKQHHRKKHKVNKLKKTPKRTDREEHEKDSTNDTTTETGRAGEIVKDGLDIAKRGRKDREGCTDRDKNVTKDDQKKKLKTDMDSCYSSPGNQKLIKICKNRSEEKCGELKDIWNSDKKMKRKKKKKNSFNVSADIIGGSMSTNYVSKMKNKRWRTEKYNNSGFSHGRIRSKFRNIGFSNDFLNSESRNDKIKDWKKLKMKNKSKSLVGVQEKNNVFNHGHIYFDRDVPSQFNGIISTGSSYKSRLSDDLEKSYNMKTPQHIYFEKDFPTPLNAITTRGSSDKSRTFSRLDKISPEINNKSFNGTSTKRNTTPSRLGQSDNVIKPQHIHFDKDASFRLNAEIAETKSSEHEPSSITKGHSLQHIHFPDDLISSFDARIATNNSAEIDIGKSFESENNRCKSVVSDNCLKSVDNNNHIHFDDDLFPRFNVDENPFENATRICKKGNTSNDNNDVCRDKRLNDNSHGNDDGVNRETDDELQNEKTDKANCDQNHKHVNSLICIESVNGLEKDCDFRNTNKSPICDIIDDFSCVKKKSVNCGKRYDHTSIDCTDVLMEKKENQVNVSPVRKHIHFDDEGENTSFVSISDGFKDENHLQRKKNRKRKRHEFIESDHSTKEREESFTFSTFSSKHNSNSDIEYEFANRENHETVDNIDDIETKEKEQKRSESTSDIVNQDRRNRKKKKHRERICDTSSEIDRDKERKDYKIKKKSKHRERICNTKIEVECDQERKSHKKHKTKKHRENNSTISENVDSSELCDSIKVDIRFCESGKNKKRETFDNRYQSDDPDYFVEGNNSIAISNLNVYVSETDLGEASDPLCDSTISSMSGKVWESAFNDSRVLDGQNNRDVESIHKLSSSQPVVKTNAAHSQTVGGICSIPEWLTAGLPDYNNNQNLYIPKETYVLSQNETNRHQKIGKGMEPDFDPMFTPDESESEFESQPYVKKCQPVLKACKESLCDIWNVLINQDRMLKDQAIQIEKTRSENRRHVKEKTELQDRVCELEILVKSLNKIIDEKDREMSGLKQDFQYLQALIEDNHGISINRESLSEIQGRITDSVSMINSLANFLQSSTFNTS